MKNIIFYAPPAAGKGTQCDLLAEKYGYKTLSIGQVLRDARNPETEVGRIIIETQDKGVLTPDDIVAKALKEEITKYEGHPIVLDGYPRNIDQAMIVDSFLTNYILINISVDRDVAFKRITGRRTCKECSKAYNVYYPDMAPKTENVCDACGGSLLIRDDDNENSFNVRFDVYEQNAPQIKAYFKERNLLREIKSGNTKYDTFAAIEAILNEA